MMRRKKNLMLARTLVGITLFTVTNARAFEKMPMYSLFLYGGPSTTLALIEIIKLSLPDFEPYWIVSIGMNRKIGRLPIGIDTEIEGSVTKYLEDAKLISFNGALGLRWLKPPWGSVLPGSFFFGTGLSYATGKPTVEVTTIGRTENVLFHMIIEYEFQFHRQSDWLLFLRDQHRSGIFGLMSGIVGGSDYLCLGVRLRI